MSVRHVAVLWRNEEGPRSLPSRVIKSPRPPRSLAVFSTRENISPARKEGDRDLGSAGLPSPGPVAPGPPPADTAPGQGLSLVLVLWVFREQGAGIVGPRPWGAAPPPPELGDGESRVCGRLDVAASGENRTRPLQCDFSGRESYDANVTVVVLPGRGVQGPVPRPVEHAVRAVAGKPGRGGS